MKKKTNILILFFVILPFIPKNHLLSESVIKTIKHPHYSGNVIINKENKIYIKYDYLESEYKIRKFNFVKDDEEVIEDNSLVCELGDDLNTCVGSSVYLDGSNCYDPLGMELSYFWFFATKPAGSNAEMKNNRQKNPYFYIDKKGDYYITLQIETTDGRCASDTIMVTAENCSSFPVAVIEYPSYQCGCPVEISLTGESSFIIGDDEIVYYDWEIEVKPAGSNAILSSNGLSDSSFIADQPGYYILSLRVYTAENSKSNAMFANIYVDEGEPPTIVSNGLRYKCESLAQSRDVIVIDYIINESESCRKEISKYILFRRVGNEEYNYVKTISDTELIGEDSKYLNYYETDLNSDSKYSYLLVGMDFESEVIVYDEIEF